MTDVNSTVTAPDAFVIRPHELGMTVRINVPGDAHHECEGLIDEIAIYGTKAHGLDFEGWDLLVAFQNGRSHAYAPYNFDDVEIVPSEAERLKARIAELLPPTEWIEQRLAQHPLGGEQNYLELARDIRQILGGTQ